MKIEELDLSNITDVIQVRNLLKQLTSVGNQYEVIQPLACIGRVTYPNIFVARCNLEIVGTISVIIEQKLIHDNGRVARIEDLVVDKEYRNIGIATHLIQKAIELANDCQCYKITLDCKPELEKFYEKHGFRHSDSHMRMDCVYGKIGQ